MPGNTKTPDPNFSQVDVRANLLDLAHDAIIVCDLDDSVLFWNRGAERLYGWSSDEIRGRPLFEILKFGKEGQLSAILRELMQNEYWEGELEQTTKDGTTVIVESRWVLRKDEQNRAIGWLKINTDITRRRKAESGLSELTARLLTLQDEERRRLARELHDSAGQLVTAIGMSLAMVQVEGKGLHLRGQQALEDADGLLKQLSSELRTLCHLLYPPLLEEAGLSAALQWYVDEYTKRSGLPVALDMPLDLGRFDPVVEPAIFRVVQECLTNVHRHSHSPRASILVTRTQFEIRVEVRDEGRGMPGSFTGADRQGPSGGVGLRGMRERIKQLRGKLEIHSSDKGTTVTATIPTEQKQRGENTDSAA